MQELNVSVSAAQKGYGDIAVANVIGSNIAFMTFLFSTT
jgi:Ca2+/Na+ antiporter